ncbi:hypothetical protein DFR87_12455 [Metallosphaera hakonensis JCM 8857 = DSM 7519]|uniref:C4-dicarboxylate ABC transporter n=2 Tax=Metallosphaera hakonensis TaxID=79601 RepID=A0A2U9IXB7_9CREN|nr:hypothetical protein DFR87_12455 [Metallosphaera hakonensis JCM 8857 = DSM 7519]
MFKRVLYEISVLSPSYFGAVMATGTVSLVLYVNHLIIPALLLTFLNLAMYIILLLFLVIRILKFPRKVEQDLKRSDLGPGFLTLIAGTDVVGDEMILLFHQFTLALTLWITSLVLWLTLQYYFLLVLILREEKNGFKDVNGLWLLFPVSTLTISVLAVDLSSYLPSMIYAGLITYFMGWIIYLVFTVLIAFRLFLSRVSVEEMIPAYWINGGFPALASLSSSLMVIHSASLHSIPILHTLHGFLEGTGLFIWTYGSWWIPLLFLLFLWKHVVRKVSFLKYDFQFWSALFPLAIYDLGTYFTGRVTRIPGILLISYVFLYVVLILWIYQFAGLIYNVFVKLRKPIDGIT